MYRVICKYKVLIHLHHSFRISSATENVEQQNTKASKRCMKPDVLESGHVQYMKVRRGG